MPKDLILRDYQSYAVRALLDQLDRNEFPVVSLPTGSGKSVVIAGLVAECLSRGMKKIVVTVPTRELAEQNERALRLAVPVEDIGVVCAALGRNEVRRKVIVGTPQSLRSRLPYGPVDLVIVDEAHQMPLHKKSNFAALFDVLPKKRATPRAGLSATTFRTADGAIFGGPKSWFTCQPFEMSVGDLMERGHLASVRYVEPSVLMSVKGVKKSAGDYNQAQLVMANMGIVDQQVELIVDRMRSEQRRKAMVFAVTVDHAEEYVRAFRDRGEEPSLIIGAMGKDDRAENVARFKQGATGIAVTVQAALTGFDVPDIDLIASCRPTMSAIIHTQSIGRGTRPAPGKRDLLVMDFAANIPAFGPVENPHFDGTGQPRGGRAPWRACRACGTYNHYSVEACFHCDEPLQVKRVVRAEDLEFGTIDFWKESKAMEALITAHGMKDIPVESFAVHGYRKKSDPNSISLMVSFALGDDAIVRLWFKWMSGPWCDLWKKLQGDMPPPKTINDAYARRGELVRPETITIERSGNFWNLVAAGYADDDGDDLPVAEERVVAAE